VALVRAADSWGATFQASGTSSGRLELPVNAGLRQGRLSGTVRFDPAGDATELTFEIEREDYQLPTAAVGLLLSGIVGALPVLLWPFAPRLARIAPFGAVIAVGVWFLVLAKVRYVGAEVFFDRVVDETSEESAERE
jgi:hypothetical protein